MSDSFRLGLTSSRSRPDRTDDPLSCLWITCREGSVTPQRPENRSLWTPHDEKVQEISDPLDEARSVHDPAPAPVVDPPSPLDQQADGHPVENTPGALGDPALSTTSLPAALGGVMTLHKLAAGSGYTYLTRQVAVHDRAERSQVGLAAYYEEKGESPGRWLGGGLAGLDLADGDVVTEEQMKLLFGQGRHPRSQEPDAVAPGWGSLGRGFPTFTATSLRQEVAAAFSEHNTSRGRRWNASIPTEVRAGIRTEVATRAFVRTNGRAPYDDTELTGFVATASKAAQTPVAGYDLTFSPVKSVSALWALAAPDVAREVQAAHEAAVRATIGLLEREVAFTRVGKGGIRQVPVTGVVAAAFDHRDSRAGDPDLHTHVVISNKVQTLPSEGGKWLTLDGRMVFKAKVMASEHYNTRLEAELTERLGVRFTERPSPRDDVPCGRSSASTPGSCRCGPRAAVTSRAGSDSWLRRSRPTTDGHRRGSSPSPWPSRPTSRPAPTSTNPAACASNATSGGPKRMPSWPPVAMLGTPLSPTWSRAFSVGAGT